MRGKVTWNSKNVVGSIMGSWKEVNSVLQCCLLFRRTNLTVVIYE